MIDSGCMSFRMLWKGFLVLNIQPACEIYTVKPMFFPVHVRISVRDFVVVVVVVIICLFVAC